MHCERAARSPPRLAAPPTVAITPSFIAAEPSSTWRVSIRVCRRTRFTRATRIHRVRILRDRHRVPDRQDGRRIDQEQIASRVQRGQRLGHEVRQQELTRVGRQFTGGQDLQFPGAKSPSVHVDDVERICQLDPHCDTGESGVVAQAEEPVDAWVPQIEVEEDDVPARLGQGHGQIRGRRRLVLVLAWTRDQDRAHVMVNLRERQPALDDPECLGARTPSARSGWPAARTAQDGGWAWEPDRATAFRGSGPHLIGGAHPRVERFADKRDCNAQRQSEDHT